MKYFRAMILMLVLAGCADKQMSAKDTIHQYYEAMLQGQIEKSQQFLEWDGSKADVIDYYVYSSIYSLDDRRKYDLMSIEDIRINIIGEQDGEGTANVELIFIDQDGFERTEHHTVTYRLNSKGNWKLTSIMSK